MSWRNRIPFIRRAGVAEKPLLDREYIEESLAASPVPFILVTVLIWAVASVLLLLSENHQRDLTVWVDGQHAPFSVWARSGFSYIDTAATRQKQEEARSSRLPVYRIDPGATQNIRQECSTFFATLRNRKNPQFVPGNSAGEHLAMEMHGLSLILPELEKKQSALEQRISDILHHGIAGNDDKIPVNQDVRILSPEEISYTLRPPSAAECADELTGMLHLPAGPEKEFSTALVKLLARGNLRFDREASDEAARIAAEGVAPVIKTRRRGELLIERNQLITRETVDMFEAEKLSLPRGYGLALLGNQLVLSFILLLTSLFFLYRVYPQIFQTPRRFTIAGFAVILALLANFGAIQLFFYFFRKGILPDYELMLFMIPMPFGAALLSILLGNRTALFAGFLIASVSALMILPDRSFELVLRWFAISALITLFIRDVSNYRSFFIRVFFCGAALTAVVNFDAIYSLHSDPRMLKLILLLIAGNAFTGAIAALLAVFVFELLFNVDTTMSLMVLSDYNHPLLEKLKREAPGTMFHSMTVATLAEDAARAIRANPARAKAGALFHDIGKLSMPQYFVENNVDSPKEYLNMPPQRSCGIIRGHVKEGLNLAREYRLCSFVREAIATHHGDDLISFFYHRALEQSHGESLPVLESQFRYDGEPPVGKELTIISLADACEAASRSLNKPSPAKLESLVNEIFIGRIRGGQLRNSSLTTHELDVIRECFITDLISFNHGRIAYKKESTDDTTALPVAEPPDAAAEKE